MITLRGITWQNPRGYDPLVAAAKAWMAEHPGVEIIWEQLPWYQFEETVLASLAKGDAYYDLVMFDHPWVGKLASESWLVPLEALFEAPYIAHLGERIVSPSLESYEWAGKHWALPLDAACHAALYRADLVEGDSLPQNWEEVRSWARAHHQPPHRYGLVLSLEGVLGHCLFLSMMAGLGHPPYRDPDHPVFDRSAAEYVLTHIKELVAFTPPASTRWGPWDIFEHLSHASDVGYSPSIFAYVNYFEGLPHSDELRLATVPAFEGRGPACPILGGVGLGITRAGRHHEIAAQHGAYLASDAVQRDIFPAFSGQPAAAVAWDDPDLNRHLHGFYAALKENMKTAYIRPRYPSFHALELRNGAILQQWWDDRLSLHETIERLAALPATLKESNGGVKNDRTGNVD